MSRVIDDTPQGIEITGVGQQIEIDDLPWKFFDPMADEAAADESSATGNKDPFHSSLPLKIKGILIVIEPASTLGRIRTCDLRFRKPLLYPLSYEGFKKWPTIGFTRAI